MTLNSGVSRLTQNEILYVWLGSSRACYAATLLLKILSEDFIMAVNMAKVVQYSLDVHHLAYMYKVLGTLWRDNGYWPDVRSLVRGSFVACAYFSQLLALPFVHTPFPIDEAIGEGRGAFQNFLVKKMRWACAPTELLTTISPTLLWITIACPSKVFHS